MGTYRKISKRKIFFRVLVNQNMTYLFLKLTKSALEVSPYKWKGGLVRQPENVHVADAPGFI